MNRARDVRRAIGLALLLGLLLPRGAGAADREDLILADFEGDDYGAWTATGTAFGPGPARGALPGQMAVEGFLGRGLVNSFHGGDDATGTLTSPPFRVERRYINALVGGGKYPGETCLNLVVDGQAARTATGPNDQPGGSERLDWHTWDVADLAGRTATLQIIDRRTGGWGHINVDQVVQSDRRFEAAPARRETTIQHRYLHLPVKNGHPRSRMRFEIGGEAVREFDIELADAAPDFLVFADVSAFQGQPLTVAVDRLDAGSKGLESIVQADEVPGADRLYREKYRPQFHFTSRRGWLNDPNGLVFDGSSYHLFYQHNPFGREWGNMHWGHATSPDLVHWTEGPIALYPRAYGDWAFSGSAVVDRDNTSGFQSGKEDVLVLAYTSTGRGECIAYSNDRGRTWTEFDGNPVVRHNGRDPRLLWFAPAKHWVMAVYDEQDSKRMIAFYRSPDLKQWTLTSRIDGFFECPDLYELPVDGDPARRLWVLSAADGKYLLGTFDGSSFQPQGEKQQVWHGNFYAAQTFSHAPDGRRIQIGWGQGITFPGMPFNQQMTVPVDLTLKTTADGPRLHARPVAELDTLRRPEAGEFLHWKDVQVDDAGRSVTPRPGDLIDLSTEFEPGAASEVTFSLRGVPLVYDAKARTLSCRNVRAPLSPIDGRVRLRVLVDRGSIEAFGNDGRVALSVGVVPPDDNHTLEVKARGGPVLFRSADAYEPAPTWGR